MDYEKKYKEAINRAKAMVKVANSQEEIYNSVITIFPELKESEDERIRKELIFYLRYQHSISENFEDIGKWIAWLEKQDTERKQLYVRFGDIPSNEKSKIYHGEDEIGDENGVSVYPAFELNGNIVLGLTLPITKTTLYTQQHLLEYDNRPCYLVSGDYVGKGTDGEPLIKNISVIKRLDNYRIKECEEKPAIEMITPEESLGIDSETYNKIVDECIYGDDKQKPADKIKPKFKVGDKVIGIVSDMQYYITDVCYDHYYTESGCIIMFCSQDNFKLVEQKPAWSEEDEKMVANLVDYFKLDDALQYTEKQVVDWLKSLKGRAQLQPNQEWSEEDQNALEDVREAVVHYWGGDTQDILLYWLKSLKQRIAP